MKKFYALAAALFLGMGAFAQTTYSVTFQVDMGSATINSNGVHVAGSFQSWSPSTTSIDAGRYIIYLFNNCNCQRRTVGVQILER